MRSFIIALCIAGVIVAGSIAYTSHLDNVSQELSQGNQQVAQLIAQEDYSQAGEMLRQVQDYLEEKKSVLAATGNHEDLDKMEIYLSELEQYIKGEQKVDALAHCEVLDVLFNHLPKNYKLKAENIL